MRNRRSAVGLNSRAVYGVMGWIGGMAVALLLYFAWKPDEYLLVSLPLTSMVLALWYGESSGRIPTVEEDNRPITLFPEDSPSERR